jgi:hypothetical protein
MEGFGGGIDVLDVEISLGGLTMVVWRAHHQTVVADSQEGMLISG